MAKGRPRKPADTRTAAQFGRDALILWIFDRVRATGEKHSEAIKEVVAQLKKKDPTIRISDGTVRRTLALLRSRGSRTALIFENRSPSEQDLRHRAWIRQEIAKLESRKTSASTNPEFKSDPTETGVSLSIRIGPKPIYPRANRKSHR